MEFADPNEDKEKVEKKFIYHRYEVQSVSNPLGTRIRVMSIKEVKVSVEWIYINHKKYEDFSKILTFASVKYIKLWKI